MKDINLKKFFIVFCFSFSIIVSLRGQNWYTVVSIQANLSACGSINHMGVGFSSPSAFEGGYTCQTCTGSTIKFSSKTLNNNKITSFYGKADGAVSGWKDGKAFDYCSSFSINNVYVSTSGQGSGSFQNNCGGGTCYASVSFSANYYHYYNFKIADYTKENSVKHPLSLTIPGLDTVKNLSRFSFQVALENSNTWKSVSFSKLQVKSGANFNGTLSYDDIIGSNTDWIGQVLKIRLIQTVQDGIILTSNSVSFKFLNDIEISTDIAPECPGKKDGKLSISYTSTAYPLGGPYYFDVTIYPYTIGCENCTGRCVTIGSSDYCLKPFLIQNTGIQSTNPYQVEGIPEGKYILEVYNGTYSYPAYKIIEIKNNDLFPSLTPAYINGSSFNVLYSGADVSVPLNISGGQSPYSYSFDGSAYNGITSGSNITFSNVTGAGTEVSKTIYVKDNYGCVIEGTTKLKVPAAVQIDVTPSPPTCHSSDIGTKDDGSLLVSITGGIPGYNIYLNGSTTPYTTSNATYTIPSLTVGSYDVKVEDYAGRPDEKLNQEIAEPTNNIGASASITTANLCYGDKAKVTVSGSGGSGYTYNTAPNGTFQGPNVFEVTDNQTLNFYVKSGSCIAQSNAVTIPENPKDITIGISNRYDESCDAANNGSVSLGISNGTPFSDGYDITFGGASSRGYFYNNSTLNYNTYHYSIRDSRGCIKEGDVIINPSSGSPLTIGSTISKDSASCSNIHDGSLGFSINPGERAFPPYSYVLTGPTPGSETIVGTSKTFSGLQNGNYSLTVTDNVGCIAELNNIPLDIITNTLAFADSVNTKATCAESQTGILGITPKKGFPFGDGYNIKLFKQGETPTIESVRKTSYTFNPLFIGNYKIEIADSKGCIIDKKFEVKANLNPVSISFSDTINQSCKEVANGTLRVTASSIGPNNVNYGIASITNLTLKETKDNDSIYYENQNSFYYEFKAVDKNNCFAEASYNLLNLKNNPHLVVLSYDSVACQNDHTGTIRLGVKQKIRQPEYKFFQNKAQNFMDSIFSNLASQRDTFLVIDSDGCPGDTILSVPVIASSVKFKSDPFIENASCFNSANGKITVTATNGIPFNEGKYRYEINTGEVKEGTSAIFDGLKANTDYIITATDSRNCIRSTAKIPVRVIDDSLRLLTPAPTNATCVEKATGKVLVTKVNGDPFKTGFLFVVKDSDGKVIQTKKLSGTESSISLTGFARGSYTVSVTDSNKCSVSKPFIIGYNPLFSSNGSVVSRVRRFGKAEGQVRSTINDGSGRFVYQLYRSEDLANAVRSDTVKNSILQIDQLYAGSYVLKVKDTANCKYENDEWMEDDIFIQQPEKALALSIASQTNVFCFGDSTASVKLQPEGGYREYLYSINDTNTFKRDSTFNKLKSGIYKLYVRDSARVDTFIYVTVTQPARALSPANANVRFATCYGYTDGSAVVNAVGGTPPYRLSIDSAHWSSSGKITNLAAGVYRVIIKDTLNCVAYLNDVIVDQPDPVSVKKFTITNTPCLKSEGKIDITQVNGGNGEYTYSWTKDNSSLGAQPSLSSLRSGAYRLSLIDGMGCWGDTTFFVADLSDIRVDFTTTPVSCWGGADGKAEMTVVRGATPFREVQWPGVPSGLYATTALDSGLYRVVMEDNLGCRRDTVFRVSSISEIQIPERWITDPLCLGNNNGEITLNASGGNGGYRYDWGTTGTGSNIDRLSPGTYTVSVTDANNCVKSFEFNLAYAKLEKPNLGRDMQLCSKSDYILSHAGFETYDWRLNNRKISSEPAIIVKEPGDYVVNVVSDEGCIGSDTVNITYGADEMLADFLLTTKAYAGDTIMLVEISRPLPDSVTWFLDLNAKLLDYGKYYKQIALADTGTYEFSMVSYYKGCADMVQKYIQVVPADPESKKKSAHSDLIQYVSLYPNPNNGRFDVDLRLSNKSDVLVRLVNLGNGTIESSRMLKGSDMYTEHFELTLSPGMYTLYIQAGKESRTVNMVVL